MMRRNIKRLILVTVWMILVTFTLAGCGTKSDDLSGGASNEMTSESFDGAGDFMDHESSVLQNIGESTAEGDKNSSVSTNRKIIEKVYLSVETKEFDVLLEKISEEIEKIGGYVESSTVSGNSYRYESDRYADFIVRVPSDKSNEFTAFVSENSTVTSKEIDTEDVTLSYVDLESRVSALQTEQAALESLLAKAETLEDIITIQDKLTDVIYEIESYQSKLRTYDNLIEYTTISIYIYEVEKVTIIEEQTMWEEIGINLKENFKNVGYGLKRTFVFIASNIPYILVLAAIIFGVVFLTKIHKKKTNKNLEKKKELKAERQENLSYDYTRSAPQEIEKQEIK